MDLQNILHAAPNSFANSYNLYDPDTSDLRGAFVLNNLSNPALLVCGAIGAVENTTAPETAKLCGQYLGPMLRLLNFNYLPIPLNPYLSKSADPSNILYSDPALAPGGVGVASGPPEIPPAVSAYTGASDNPFPATAQVPPPFPPGPSAPDHGPAAPSPALYPGAPVPTPPGPSAPTLQDMLLPAEAAPPGIDPHKGVPLPVEGTPTS